MQHFRCSMQGTSATDGNSASLDRSEQPECDATYPGGYENRFDRMLRYKFCNLDMDISSKSDRIEWGHLRYQTVFYPDASLEFIFQWVVCTGPLVYELVNFPTVFKSLLDSIRSHQTNQKL